MKADEVNIEETKKEQTNKEEKRHSIIDESPELDTEADLSEAEFGEKLLTKIQDGSLVHTAVSLIGFSPITLYLIIPRLFAQSGLLCCCMLLLFIIFTTYCSLCVILKIIIEKRFTEYYTMIKGFVHYSLYYIFHICFYVFSFTYCFFNLILVYQILSLLITESSLQKYPKLILMISTFILQFPLTLLSKTDYQRIIKVAQIIFIFIGTIIYLFADPSNIPKDETQEYVNAFLFSNKPHLYFLIFGTFNVLTFHQINIFQEISHLKTFTIKRGHSLIKIVLIIQIIIIFILGLLGSLAQRDKENHNLFYFLHNEHVYESKFLSILLMLIILVCLSESSINVSRSVIVFLRFRNERVDRKVHAFVCGIVVLALNVMCSMVKEDFIKRSEGFFVLGMGGVVIGVIQYLIPGLLYGRVVPELTKNQKNMNMGLFCIMIGIGIAVSSIGMVLLGVS